MVHIYVYIIHRYWKVSDGVNENIKRKQEGVSLSQISKPAYYRNKSELICPEYLALNAALVNYFIRLITSGGAMKIIFQISNRFETRQA